MTDQEILSKQLLAVPMETAARWYCELNCFMWPKDFPIPEPLGLLGWRDKYQHPVHNMAFNTVAAFLPDKEKSRAWHVLGYAGGKKTNEEFEKWWAAEEEIHAEVMAKLSANSAQGK